MVDMCHPPNLVLIRLTGFLENGFDQRCRSMDARTMTVLLSK